jgi:hypothetical protein
MPNHALLNLDQARSSLVMIKILVSQAARPSLHFSVGPDSGTPDCLLSSSQYIGNFTPAYIIILSKGSNFACLPDHDHREDRYDYLFYA